MRKIIALFGLIVLLGSYQVHNVFKQPTPFVDKAVVIPANSSLRSIAKLLEKEGVLTKDWPILVLAKIWGVSNKVKSGEFLFRTPSSPQKALNTLLNGIPILQKVTIPEGSTMKEMAPWFEAQNIINAQDLLTAFQNPELLQKYGINGSSFEGFLFPSTYLFPKNEKASKIIQIMTDELKKNLQPEDRIKAKALGWNDYQWITFASVIEKETGRPDEYGLVSSVFHNRLKKGMMLQSDPTVIYGIPNYDGNIRKVDLQTDTPWNTYTRKGLPIGPISNPGAAAIHAAVNPDTTEYLYFVGNREGQHIFTKTYEEHLKAVREYQLTPSQKAALDAADAKAAAEKPTKKSETKPAAKPIVKVKKPAEPKAEKLPPSITTIEKSAEPTVEKPAEVAPIKKEPTPESPETGETLPLN
ncbi:MAG: endolytic transglycosylase MltG [Bdellovibrionota bacterium]